MDKTKEREEREEESDMNYITLYLAEIPKHQPDNEEGFHGKDASTLLLVYLYVN